MPVGWNPLLRNSDAAGIISGSKSENICKEQMSLGDDTCLVGGEVKNLLKEN